MDKHVIDIVLFELDDIMYECGCEVLAEHTRLPDGTYIPGRRYRTPTKVSWVVRPLDELDEWEVTMYPPLSRRASKLTNIVGQATTCYKTVGKILNEMRQMAEDIAAEV